MSPALVKQAGGIVFRTDGPTVRILLVRARRNPSNWIFPKGHLEPGESHAAAALREAGEEAGIEGTVMGLVGTSYYSSGSENFRVEYYLIQMSADGPSPEGRDKQWLAPEDARAAVSFADARDLLDRATAEIRRTTSSRRR